MPKPKKPAKKLVPKTRKQAAPALQTKAGIDAFIARFAEKAAGKKVVLHLGAEGQNTETLHKNYQSDEWVSLRMSHYPAHKAHIVGGLKEVQQLPEGCVDAIWCTHMLQRLYPHELSIVIKSLAKALKTGGHLLAQVPDMQTIAGYIARGNLTEPIFDSPLGSITPIDILYGWRPALATNANEVSNHTAFTATTLGLALREGGFSNIRVTRDYYDLWAVAYKIPVGHPQYNEKISLNQNNKSRLEELPPVPPIARTPHPGALWHGRLTDELDVPPKQIP